MNPTVDLIRIGGCICVNDPIKALYGVRLAITPSPAASDGDRSRISLLLLEHSSANRQWPIETRV